MSKPLAPGRSIALAPSADRRRWTATVPAEAPGPFAFTLKDEHAIANRPEPPRRVVVLPDAAPTLAIAAPDAWKETGPEDILLVGVVARDDVAVASAELHYRVDRVPGPSGPAAGRVAAPLEGLGTNSARGEASLGLKSLGLKPGDVLAYRVRVADNRPAPRGPNLAWSGEHVLRIVEHSESLMARQATADRQDLRARLEAIRKGAEEGRQESEKLRGAAEVARQGNEPWDSTKAKALADREGSTREASDRLRRLARDLDEHPSFHPLGRPARQVAEVEVEATRVELEAARRADDPARRSASLQAARTRFDPLIARLDELLRRFDELAKLDDDRNRLRGLAERQDELAARAGRPDAGKLDALRAEQEQLRRELDELLQRSPALKAEALAAQARRADDLAARARELAEAQRAEARRTADTARREPALKALAEAQRALEDDGRQFAARVNEPLAQAERGRLDVEALARAVEPIERGDLDQGRQRTQEAEGALARLARDLEDARSDPKALARRLARREEALRNEANEALREAREHPPETPEGNAALAERLRPLADRQAAIARLAAAIPAPPEQPAAAANAARAAGQARDDLRQPRPREVEGHQNEARDALNRLADALPDPNQRRERGRQQMNEARNKSEEVGRELERHLRETAPQPNQPHDPAKAAADLAQRVAPLIQREREAAALLAAADPEPRARPQRDRAARRAEALAAALERLGQQAPKVVAASTDPRPITAWRILGPFKSDAPNPFAVDQPVNLEATYPDRKGQPAAWKAAATDNSGIVDLGQIYSREENQAAFGFVEVPGPTARLATIAIGSDDSLTLWLNGAKVYDFQGSRACTPGTDRVEVPLVAGVNRLVARCATGNGDWKFALSVTPAPPPVPPEPPEALALKEPAFERIRESLPALQVAAKATMDRLQQKLDQQVPADDRAADLAADQREAAETPAPDPDPAAQQRRAANALRNLDAPDALAAREEAARASDQAAATLDDPSRASAAAREALGHAAEAADALARRLADAQPVRERAEALAHAQRELSAPQSPPDPAEQARRQHAIADELATLPPAGTGVAADAVARAAKLADQAMRPDGPRVDPAAAAEARLAAERALADLAARQPDALPPAEAPPRERAQALARAERHLAADLQAAQDRAAAPPPAGQPGAKPTPEAADARPAADLAPIAARQQALAEAARALPDPPAAGAAPPHADARAAQERAAQAIAKGEPAAAALAAGEAATALERLARALPEAGPGHLAQAGPGGQGGPPRGPSGVQDPGGPRAPGANPPPGQAAPAAFDDPELGLTPADAAEAAGLARRERHIREGLQAILGDRARPQGQLRERAAELGREAAELRDRARGLGHWAEGGANAAADLLGRAAPEQMNRAAEGLHKGQPNEALNAQRGAADAIEQAARQAEDVAAGMRRDRPSDARGAAARGDLAAAQDAQRQAGRQLAGPATAGDPAASARAASDAMHRAAQQLRIASQSGRTPARPGGPGPDPAAAEPRGDPLGRADPDLAGLQAAVRSQTGRAWGELPGHLRTEILQMSQGRYRDDYARLIQLYFREIAADAPGPGARP